LGVISAFIRTYVKKTKDEGEMGNHAEKRFVIGSDEKGEARHSRCAKLLNMPKNGVKVGGRFERYIVHGRRP